VLSPFFEGENMKDVAYVIVAGPQASGKSVAQRHIAMTFKNTIVLREAGQILLEREQERGNALGGALVDSEFEKRVLQLDLARMQNIRDTPSRYIFIDESNVFAVAHAKVKNPDLAEILFLKYTQALDSFNTGIVFTHVTPQVSWERRQRVYEKRYEDALDLSARMKRSKEYIFQLYPHLVALYETLPYPKQQVEGAIQFQEFKKCVETAFEKVCREMGVTSERRP